MSTDGPESPDSRRAMVAPLLAAGLSIRAIVAQTGISRSGVHRAKRQIEKARTARPDAPPLVPPPSYVMQRVADGVRQDVRRLTIEVYERAVGAAIGRGLLEHGDRNKPGTVISALYAELFTDATIHWLHRHGYLAWGNCGRAEALIAAVNALIEQLPR
jgi:hypothetical protein